MEYKVATKDNINGVLALHKKYHIDTISEDDKSEGFVTTQLTRELLEELIEKESGLFIASEDNNIVSYVISASWEYCSKWPMFQYMIERLHEVEFIDRKLDVKNSYQYGPICIDTNYRGTGVLEGIFEFSRKKMSEKYPILVTFINKKNTRSIKAHTVKLGLEISKEFEYNNNSYIELVYDTSKEVTVVK